MKMSNKHFKLEKADYGVSIYMLSRPLQDYMFFSTDEFREFLRFLGPLVETEFPRPKEPPPPEDVGGVTWHGGFGPPQT